MPKVKIELVLDYSKGWQDSHALAVNTVILNTFPFFRPVKQKRLSTFTWKVDDLLTLRDHLLPALLNSDHIKGLWLQRIPLMAAAVGVEVVARKLHATVDGENILRLVDACLTLHDCSEVN